MSTLFNNVRGKVAASGFLAMVVGIGIYIFLTMDITSAVFYAIVLMGLAVGFLFILWKLCSYFEMDLISAVRLLVILAFIACLLSFVFEALTLVGAPLSTPFILHDWGKRRMVVFFVVAMLLLLALKLFWLRRSRPSIYLYKPKGFLRFVFTQGIPSTVLVDCVYNLFFALLFSIGASLVSANLARLLYLFLCVAYVVANCVCAIKSNCCVNRNSQITRIFLCASLTLGSFLAFALPAVTAISLDDQIHFDRALGLSYLGHSEITEAEIQLISVPWVHDSVLNFNEINAALRSLNDSYSQAVNSGSVIEVMGFVTPGRLESLANVTTIGYIPSAIGLWLGRLLNLSLFGQLILGRWANLVVYSTVCSVAISRTPMKPIVLACVALLPTNLYLASNYSYDPVVTAFLLLGVSLVLREMKRINKPLTIGSLLAILLVFCIGLCPKAVYFPLIGFLFLMPRSKFSTNRARTVFYFAVVAFGIVMVASFVLPMLFSESVQAGDLRGGEGVNASGQIRYILSHPFEFASTLFSFALGYISPTASDGYSLSYAYMGSLVTYLPWLSAVPFLGLVITSCYEGNISIQNNKSKAFSSLQQLWIVVMCSAALFLVISALYVAYTPVGSTSVAGVQARYLIPLLFPAFLLVGGQYDERGETNSGGVARSYALYPAVAFVGILSIIADLAIVVPW